MIDNIHALRDDLGDLSDWLHSRDIPPPLPPKKEQFVGVQPRKTTLISLAPPSSERTPGSPGSMPSGLPFLSSHHSDDYNLMESEPYHHFTTTLALTSYSTVPSMSPGEYSSPVPPSPPRLPVHAASPIPSKATVRPADVRSDGPLNDLRNMLDAIRNQAGGLQHGQLSAPTCSTNCVIALFRVRGLQSISERSIVHQVPRRRRARF
jgi:hypothetical protein